MCVKLKFKTVQFIFRVRVGGVKSSVLSLSSLKHPLTCVAAVLRNGAFSVHREREGSNVS